MFVATNSGIKTYDLSSPGEGIVTVNLKAEAPGASASATTSMWLSACE